MRAPIDRTFALLCARRHARGVEVVAERGAHAVDLVRRDLLALTAAAEHDARLGVAARDRPGDGGAVGRVVDGILGVGAEIVDVVAPLLQHPDEVLLERIAGVVAADRDAHPASVPRASAAVREVADPESASQPAQVASGTSWHGRRGAAAHQPAHLRRADEMCRRRLAREVHGGKRNANRTGDMRFAVSNRIEADARLAQAEPGRRARRRSSSPATSSPSSRRCTAPRRAATSTRSARPTARVADLGFRTALPDLGVELSSNLGIAAELADGGRELRKVLVGARRDASCSTRSTSASRSCAPRSGRRCSSRSSPST